MIRKVIGLGLCVFLGAACMMPTEPEPGDLESAEDAVEEAVEVEADPGMTPQAWPWDPPPPVCQPGTKIHQCFEWSTGCYEDNNKCGAGCKTYQTSVCNQYRWWWNGKYYYYRADCSIVYTCGGALQGQGCVTTCT
jgi:hypothetical protein